MGTPEIRPIRTTEVVLFEIVPVTKAKPDDSGAEWRAVRQAGSRLTVGVRFLDYLEARQVLRSEAPEDRVDAIMSLAFKHAQHGADVFPDDKAIPMAWRALLAWKVYELSTLGADPFASAPAGS